MITNKEYKINDLIEEFKNDYFNADASQIGKIIRAKRLGAKGYAELRRGSRNGYAWFINEEGKEIIKQSLTPKNKNEQMIIGEIQDKQKTNTYKENVYAIILNDEYAEYLHIISKSLNTNEIEIIKNVVEKFIDSKKEQIAKIFLGATNNE